MKKFIFYLLLICSAAASAQKQPNIVLFIADDLGWEESTPYGNSYVHTPNMQRLANEGMRFDNFYLTASSCSPSRVSIITSLYPHNTGAMNLHEDISPDTEIFPSRLNHAGYYTMLVGKSHGTNKKEVKAKFSYIEMANWSKPWEMGSSWVNALQQRPKDKPFFMWAASTDPHRPFRQGVYPYKHHPDSVIVPPYYPDIPEGRKDLANYYDEIGRFDEHIGQVLKYLEKENLLDNTIILVISDNGRPFAQSKTRINMQGLKSPLIIRYPALVKKGTNTQSIISAIDIAPTLLQLALAKPMKKLQGVSFVPVLKNPAATVREYAFGEHNWHEYMAYERMAVSKEFLYIHNWLPELPAAAAPEAVATPFYQRVQQLYERDSLDKKFIDCFIAPRLAEELFLVKKDMHCMNNLAADAKQKKALLKMQQVLNAWLKQTNDVFPGKEKLKQDKPDRKKGHANVKEAEG